MLQELISVIIPVYNVEEYIHKCVDSVISQSHKNLEIILVDDGSPDKCGRICDEYARRDARVRVIHQANQGAGAARNAGLAAAKGVYVGFVDPDDYILENMYAELLRLAREHGADMAAAMSNYFVITKSGVKAACLQNYSAEYLNKCTIGEIRRLTLLDKLPHYVWSALYAADIAKNTLFPDVYYAEDVLFNYKFIFQTDRVVFTDKAYYCYNLTNAGSLTKLTEDDIKVRYGQFVSWRGKEALWALVCSREIKQLSNIKTLHCAIKIIVYCYGIGWRQEEAKIANCLEYLRQNEKNLSISSIGAKRKLLWWCYKNCRTFFRAYAKLSLYLRNFRNKRRLARRGHI